jgi:alcohol dehydrogenase (cytochrome c)
MSVPTKLQAKLNPRDRGEGPQRARSLPLLTGASAILFACLALADGAHGQVTFDRLVNSAKEPQNWMTYSGDYLGRRFSALDQVNTTNVRALTAKWAYQTAATGKLETSPLVVDGILYATA